MKTGFSRLSSPAVVHFQYDRYMKVSRMFHLNSKAVTFANLELFILKIDGGNLSEYRKIRNLQREWIHVENPDVSICDFAFLKKYTKVLFDRDFFVFKDKKNKVSKDSSKVANIVKKANTSKLYS